MNPALRVQLYFFVQFMSVGMVNAFAGIWFDTQGLSSVQIGALSAIPNIVVLLIVVFVGRIADRASDWRQVIIFCAIISALTPIGLIYVTGFLGVLFFWSVGSIAQRTALPVSDAAGLRMARREGLNFGAFRGLSTLGYLLVIIFAGFALQDRGVEVFLPLFIGLGLLRGLTSLFLPKMRAPEAVHASRSAGNLRSLMKAWFLLPIIGYALLDTPHLILNSFQGLLWARQGISTETIGLLIALGAAAETAMFFAFAHVAKRFPPITLLLIGVAASIFRWLAMATSPEVPALIGLQTLHAVTYASAFLAITNYVADNVSEDNAAQAQSLIVNFELVLSSLGLMLFGWLVGHYGAYSYVASAAMAAIAGILILLGRQMRPADEATSS